MHIITQHFEIEIGFGAVYLRLGNRDWFWSA